MALNGSQIEQLQTALLRAFDEAALTQMVRIRLDENVQAIAGGDNLTELVFNLIIWAERRGRTEALIAGATASNPENPELKLFAAQYAQAAAGGAVGANTVSPVRDAWLVMKGLDFFAALPGAEVRVTASVNGTEYIYPSVGSVQWLEVGPGMSAQKFRLPPTDANYIIRFEAAVRVPGVAGKPDITGVLTSVNEDIVEAPADIPYAGRYILHTFDPVHMSRAADATAELVYRVTFDP